MNNDDDEAARRYRNAESDSDQIRSLRSQIAEILMRACTQAFADRGVYVKDADAEKLQDCIERIV